jgi:hypothetical protein
MLKNMRKLLSEHHCSSVCNIFVKENYCYMSQSTVCKRIMEKLGQVDMDTTQRQVVCISQDSFYRELTPAEKAKAEKGLFNFDHPGE